MRVCLCADSLLYPQGGGHLWVFLNWALGLRALGCEVTWLEPAPARLGAAWLGDSAARLRSRLDRYGLGERFVLCSTTGEPLPPGLTAGLLDLEAVFEADLLLNFKRDLAPALVRRFRRSACIDIDPGLFQLWWSQGLVTLTPHDVYFSIGETVGRPGAAFPDCGVEWRYTPPCVSLDAWAPHPAPADACFTTVSHWVATGDETETKRGAFREYIDLPRRTSQPLELALDLGIPDLVQDAIRRAPGLRRVPLALRVALHRRWIASEYRSLHRHGWRVRYSHDVASTPWDYQRYIQGSRGEFSCAKPSTVRLETAWISDRTLCYLASGKPAVVQHTGASRFLPDAAGLFRFRDIDGAARALEAVARDYEAQSRLARSLAEEHFDARGVVARVLEQAA